jgi:hypothetical protein
VFVGSFVEVDERGIDFGSDGSIDIASRLSDVVATLPGAGTESEVGTGGERGERGKEGTIIGFGRGVLVSRVEEVVNCACIGVEGGDS